MDRHVRHMTYHVYCEVVKRDGDFYCRDVTDLRRRNFTFIVVLPTVVLRTYMENPFNQINLRKETSRGSLYEFLILTRPRLTPSHIQHQTVFTLGPSPGPRCPMDSCLFFVSTLLLRLLVRLCIISFLPWKKTKTKSIRDHGQTS